MDPLGTVTTLVSLARYLWDVAEKVKQNREECKHLAKHIQEISRLIAEEYLNGAPEDLTNRLTALSNTISGLTNILDELGTKPRIMQLIWRNDISDRIKDAYKSLSEATQLCKMGISFDMRRVMEEHEQARQMDSDAVLEKLDEGLLNDREIISRLEVHKAQMQEAMIAIHKKLQTLELGSAERPILEKGMHAMQRRSGPVRLTPDDFVITSLDVIIHEDKKLGEGGFGQVYLGDWQGVTVAVKVLEKGVPRATLQREIDVWKRLRHPHILQFHGACSIADPPFAVCAYKANGDALEYLMRHPNADRLKLLHDASLGLLYLHANSVVHGDIKAVQSNILIDEDGRACLADFGLSKIKTSTTTMNRPAAAPLHAGSARWMAPEQLTTGAIGRETDVYSFGMTIYEVFTGTPPFASTPEYNLLNVVVDRGMRPLRPNDARPLGLGNRMWELVETCWAGEPNYRPSAPTVAERIKACQQPPPVTGSERPTPQVGGSSREPPWMGAQNGSPLGTPFVHLSPSPPSSRSPSPIPHPFIPTSPPPSGPTIFHIPPSPSSSRSSSPIRYPAGRRQEPPQHRKTVSVPDVAITTTDAQPAEGINPLNTVRDKHSHVYRLDSKGRPYIPVETAKRTLVEKLLGRKKQIGNLLSINANALPNPASFKDYERSSR